VTDRQTDKPVCTIDLPSALCGGAPGDLQCNLINSILGANFEKLGQIENGKPTFGRNHNNISSSQNIPILTGDEKEAVSLFL